MDELRYFKRSSSMAARVIVISLFSVVPTTASWSASVEEIANYKGADRQAVLESGAKKEGELLLYAVGTQVQPLIDRFHEKYPYVSPKMVRADSSETARRVMEEYKAGVYHADGFELSSAGLLPIREAGLLQPFVTSQSASYGDDAKEPNRLWVSARESYGGIGYNTESIKPADAPKTWEDLLNPRFKGKMGISSSTSTVANWTGALVVSFGEDFVRKLGKQKIRLFKMSSRAVANLNVTGELPISARASNAHIASSRKKGAPVAWIDPGVVAVSDASVAILKRAPHPHAMMLMIDFLLSKEGQQMYGKLGYSSARNDIESATSPKKKIYLENRPTYLQDFDKWVALFDQAVKNAGS